MRGDIPLHQLPECRFFSGLRIGRARQDVSDVLSELLIDDRIKLLICYAQQVLLRSRAELQPNRSVSHGSDVSLYQSADRLLDPGLPERLGGCRVVDQRFHQRPAHNVPVFLG